MKKIFALSFLASLISMAALASVGTRSLVDPAAEGQKETNSFDASTDQTKVQEKQEEKPRPRMESGTADKGRRSQMSTPVIPTEEVEEKNE